MEEYSKLKDLLPLLFHLLGFVSCVNQHYLLANYLHDVKDILQLYELSTGKFVQDRSASGRGDGGRSELQEEIL